MHYDLTDLKVFLAIAEEGNLSRGADRCHLAPSSVSLRMKGLESATGTTLLRRQARGVTLTPAGQIVAEHARRCIAQLEQMQADLLPFAQGLTNRVTIFANNNAVSSYLPDDLARFFVLYPSVRITLEERLSHDIIAAVAAGRADLGIGVVALEAAHPDLDFVPYREDRLVLLTSSQSELGKRGSVSFVSCLTSPFISLQHGAALHTFLMNQAASIGARLDVRVQVSGYRAIARLVSSGAGIGIVPRSAVEPDISAPLNVVELSDQWAKRDLYVCVRRQPIEKNHFRDRLIEILCNQNGVVA